MTIGERIKEVRKSNGLTLEKFGAAIQIKAQSVSMIEKGINNPSAQTISLICREFHVNEAWLRTGEGDAYQPSASTSLDDLVKSEGLEGKEADIVMKLVQMYCSLRQETRREIMERFDEYFGGSAIPVSALAAHPYAALYPPARRSPRTDDTQDAPQ